MESTITHYIIIFYLLTRCKCVQMQEKASIFIFGGGSRTSDWPLKLNLCLCLFCLNIIWMSLLKLLTHCTWNATFPTFIISIFLSITTTKEVPLEATLLFTHKWTTTVSPFHLRYASLYLVRFPKERHILRVEFFGLACFLVPLFPCSEAKKVPFFIVYTGEHYEEKNRSKSALHLHVHHFSCNTKYNYPVARGYDAPLLNAWMSHLFPVILHTYKP